MVGYLPDTFGHVATLPSILNGFGISTFLFFRGVGDEGEGRKDEFIWESPDGSSVLAVFLRGSYCHAERIGLRKPEPPGYASASYDFAFKTASYYYRTPFDAQSALALISSQLELRRANSAFNTYLFLNGCDHRPPQDLKAVLELARKNFAGVEFTVADLDDYSNEIKSRAGGVPLATYSGELRGAKYTMVDPGILSTRADVKQKNFYAENTLESYAEPLSAAMLALGSSPRPLDYAWKLVLRSQAHDSICNSGVDEVNEQVSERFDRAQEAAFGTAQDALDFLSQQMPLAGSENDVLIFNPTNSLRTDLVSMVSYAPIKGLVDFEENESKGSVGKLHRYNFVVKGVPPVGYARVQPAEQRVKAIDRNEVENEYYAVSLGPDGSLTLLDKSSNRS
ncbi:MAG: hypothetical protein ACP5T2_06855, partial [Thermoprotei archaeon]